MGLKWSTGCYSRKNWNASRSKLRKRPRRIRMKFSTEEFVHPDTGFKALPPVYEIDGDEKAYTLMELDLAPALGGLPLV